MTALFDLLVIIRGGGGIGSGVAYRLVKAGFPVIITELPQPSMVQTTVSYGVAVDYTSVIVEGITASVAAFEDVTILLAEDKIPILVDPTGISIRRMRPPVVIDARNAGHNLDTTIDDAPLVIGLGMGFTAGIDCHAVVDTQRGYTLGQVNWSGSVEPIMPADEVKTPAVHFYAPIDGELVQIASVGDCIKAGDLLARVDTAYITAEIDGVVTGMVDNPARVTAGHKIGTIDQRSRREHCFTISDKSLAIGGGVVEAVLSAPQIRGKLRG